MKPNGFESSDPDLQGGSPSSSKRRARSAASRQKTFLETVAERSNEMSGDYTELLQKSMKQKTKQSSPFLVEKFDYNLSFADEGSESRDSPAKSKTNRSQKAPLLSRTEQDDVVKNLGGEWSIHKGYEEKTKKNDFEEKSLNRNINDFELDSIPVSSYRTPVKKSKPGKSFSNQSDVLLMGGAKGGFFSMRKKSQKDHTESSKIGAGTPFINIGSGSAGNVKIINNIFQNTILHSPKNEDLTQKKILNLKSFERPKSTNRKKGNLSIDTQPLVVKSHRGPVPITPSKPSRTILFRDSPQNSPKPKLPVPTHKTTASAVSSLSQVIHSIHKNSSSLGKKVLTGMTSPTSDLTTQAIPPNPNHGGASYRSNRSQLSHNSHTSQLSHKSQRSNKSQTSPNIPPSYNIPPSSSSPPFASLSQYRRFHSKLSDCMGLLGYSPNKYNTIKTEHREKKEQRKREGQVRDIKECWHFVKDLVENYCEARNRIEVLEKEVKEFKASPRNRK